MNRSIIVFSALLGECLSLYLLATGLIPDFVGIAYCTIIAMPFMVD